MRTSVLIAASILLVVASAQAQTSPVNGPPLASPPPTAPPSRPPPPDPPPPSFLGSVLPSGHFLWGVGGAIGSPDRFRTGLDASLGFALGGKGARGGKDEEPPWTIGPSIVTGFGAYPTYVSLDLGRVVYFGGGLHTGVAGAVVTLGPAFRLAPGTGVGGEVSARFYLVFFQAGLRAIVIGTGGGEAQIQGTLGVGFF